jgi:predicted ATPase/class 3 adenylate cyclase
MPELPSGTVTFLLTDIEGSTRLWELYPESMRPALVRHDALISETVHRQGGTVIRSRGEGDSLFAVFARATDAVAAAGAAQQQLQAEKWSTPTPLRVRMALHTGEADLRGGDYYGSAVNRCARLRAAAHGGQVLLSGATQALVQDQLPEGISLHDLGEHRLKDLVRPERIYQLRHPDLPADFPPLKTLDTRPNNLPVQPTPLLGREGELETARGLLRQDDVRLLTLTGPGGTGKTRLGLQAAADLADEFEDGVFFIALASVSDPELVGSAIAQALGVRETGEPSFSQSLKRALREKQLLLLLDNFEQVLPAGRLVSELLASCPRLKLLVTSRAALHLRGEREFPVPPLALPDPRRLPAVETLLQYAAVGLFIQQALAVKPDFAVTNENAPAVAEICHRLDGLPLAIELAAARVKLLSPQRMLSRLESRLNLLTGGARDLPARQQTLRGAITWSYDLLEAEEKSLFQRLAVFVGGCTLEDAEAVCSSNGDLELDVLGGTGSLVDKSLLRHEERGEDEARLTMLETIREYALERLEESGERDELRRRHAHHFLELAEAAAPRIQSADQGAWLRRL